jgi:hypothetical protein
MSETKQPLKLTIKKPTVDPILKTKVVVINKIDKEIESNVVFDSILKAKLVVSEQSVIKHKQSTKNVDMGVAETQKKVEKVEKVESDKFTYKLYWKILNHLQKKHPECFTVPAAPLAIGIHKELINENILIDLNINKRKLKLFFHYYTNKPEYIEAVANGVERVGIK